MKTLTLFLLLLPCFFFSQSESLINLTYGEMPIKGRLVIYEAVVTLQGVSKETLYGAVKMAFANDLSFRLKSEDNTTGHILGASNTFASIKNDQNKIGNIPASLAYNLQADCQNEKVRIRLFDIDVKDNLSAYEMPIEIYGSSSNDKNINPKHLPRVIAMRPVINEKLNKIVADLSDKIKAHSLDTF